ncbi:hypothetical protein EJB05_32489, partial [Eragrostis curvula]
LVRLSAGMVMARAQLALLALLLTAASSCAAWDFIVGGRDGWTTNPGEPHNRWAERMRFQVNDTLVFRYDKNVDAVLRVSQSHYDACNTTEPWKRLDGGDDRFTFDVSGPFFFISGDARRCQAGERLIVVVLAIRNNAPSPLPLSPPPPPKSASSSSPAPPPPAAPTPASPPPVPSPTPHAVLSPPSASAGNASSPSPAPLIAPVPGTKNGTSPRSTSSSAVALRAGVLACLLIGAAAAVL